MSKVYDVVIIGAGPAGCTAALYCARAGFTTMVIEKTTAGGQMCLAHSIENYPGFECGIDGFELAENVRELNEDIPILFMTAKDDIASKKRGFLVGVDDYMVKPVDFDELFLRIGALLRRAKIASNRKLEIGRFMMDADEHTAYLDDEEIQMTNREFSILYKLLSYPKKTFTRMQLMDEFWDADTETAPRAVDVYMTKLRTKLSDCDDFEIVTVHGLGYKAVLK